MGSRLAAQVKNADKANPLKRVKPGVFALSEWDDKTVEAGLEDRTPALELIKRAEEKQAATAAEPAAEASEETPAEATPSESEPTVSEHVELDGLGLEGPQALAPDEDEQHRAELSASATELFASEDDDDQPIFGAAETESAPAAAAAESDDKGDPKRKRRRRRGRNRRDDDLSEDDGDDLPGYTVSDAEPAEVLSADELGDVFDKPSALDSPSFGDALYEALSKQSSSRGGVSSQSLADSFKKKFRSELGLSAAALVAVAVADNLASERQGSVPRFRIAGSHLSLSPWYADRRQSERSQELSRLVDQAQKAALRSLSDELRRLPQRAVGELVVLLLNQMGATSLSTVRRPGAHGSELHLSAQLNLPGAVSAQAAIVIRRDGRDVGREKVTELRGAFHHYGSPSVGWLISTGQVLSGAKEEAQAKGASPVTLTGRTELAELFLRYGIGVKTHSLELPLVDSALFDSLSGK